MKQLVDSEILELVLKDFNKMAIDLDWDDRAKIEDFVIVGRETENFTNRAFHIDNGVYSLKTGVLYKTWVTNKEMGCEYVVYEYHFENSSDYVQINLIG